MKNLFLIALLVSQTALADTFDLPEGITFRARGVGYDCGEFFTDFKSAPLDYKERAVDFVQLAADKDLNAFVSELKYPGTHGEVCSYGIYFRRERDTKTLNFERSEIVATNVENCLEKKEWLDDQLSSVKYYASKRGIRFIALELPKVNNDICESGTVRTVFDRR